MGEGGGEERELLSVVSRGGWARGGGREKDSKGKSDTRQGDPHCMQATRPPLLTDCEDVGRHRPPSTKASIDQPMSGPASRGLEAGWMGSEGWRQCGGSVYCMGGRTAAHLEASLND